MCLKVQVQGWQPEWFGPLMRVTQGQGMCQSKWYHRKEAKELNPHPMVSFEAMILLTFVADSLFGTTSQSATVPNLTILGPNLHI